MNHSALSALVVKKNSVKLCALRASVVKKKAQLKQTQPIIFLFYELLL